MQPFLNYETGLVTKGEEYEIVGLIRGDVTERKAIWRRDDEFIPFKGMKSDRVPFHKLVIPTGQ